MNELLQSPMSFYGLVLGTLATWRITHLFVYEDGPFDLVIRLRRWAGEGFLGKLMDCFYCSSIWAAAPLAILIGMSWVERLLLWLALSSGAIVLEKIVEYLRVPQAQPAGDHDATRKTTGCCDKTRETWRIAARQSRGADPVSAGPAGPSPARNEVYFEYTGPKSLSIVGSITSSRYTFPHPGAVVAVDSRDAPSLAGIPSLRKKQPGG